MIPKDDFPYVEDLRRFPLEPERGCVELFVRPYDDDFISPSLKTIIRLYGSVEKTDLEMQTKATIWLDDRTYSAYIHPNTFVSPLTHGHQNHKSMPSPNLVELDNQSQGNSDRDCTTNSIPSVAEDSYTQSASARYSPTSRRPKVPLTAKMLYTFLREECQSDVLLLTDSNSGSTPNACPILIDDSCEFFTSCSNPTKPTPTYSFILNPDGYDFAALTETAPKHQHEALKDAIAKYLGFRPLMEIRLYTEGKPSYQFNFHLPFFAMRTDANYAKRTNIKPRRNWINLSFVSKVLPEAIEAGDLGLYPAQISFTICGTSVKQYVAYGFEDAEFDTDREFGEDEFSLNDMHPDQMTKGKENANCPVWNPRQYFLVTLKHRIRQVREEWEQVVVTLQDALSGRKSHSLRWYHRMLDLLHILLPVLDDTVGIWRNFIANNGDIGYFSNSAAEPCDPYVRNTLHIIHQEFGLLERLNQDLLRIQTRCEKEQTSTGARTMEQSNYSTMLMLQYIGPLSLVMSFFTIDEPFVEVERSLASFVGFNLLLILLVRLVRFVVEGQMYRPQWCDTIAIRAERLWQDDRDIIKKTVAGGAVLQRRPTHEWHKKTD
ncbi:hypothetical protein IG631_12631 [Alternaria alternata]|nr:hypothetical protein IG631_12631 [Alternaria alternata]